MTALLILLGIVALVMFVVSMCDAYTELRKALKFQKPVEKDPLRCEHGNSRLKGCSKCFKAELDREEELRKDLTPPLRIRGFCEPFPVKIDFTGKTYEEYYEKMGYNVPESDGDVVSTGAWPKTEPCRCSEIQKNIDWMRSEWDKTCQVVADQAFEIEKLRRKLDRVSSKQRFQQNQDVSFGGSCCRVVDVTRVGEEFVYTLAPVGNGITYTKTFKVREIELKDWPVNVK